MTSSSAFSRENRRDLIVTAKILMPLLFILIISAIFHVFIYNAVNANLAINCGIILAATYGIALILSRLFSAQQDFRVIERFGHEASQGVYMKTLLEEPWLKKRYVRHYLSHIANTGGTLSSQMDQAAIESELHALQNEYDSKLELPQFLVGFMIAMGLLGTFIGLLKTLTGISTMLDGFGNNGTDIQAQVMNLVVQLREPLNGMGIAFSASMFGLVTSLMLAIMMTNLRRYISRVMALARNVMHELTEMTRTTSSAGASKQLTPEEIAAMAREKPATGSGGGTGGGIVSSTLIAGRFDVLTKKIELLLEAFETSIAGTQKMTELLGFGPRMKELSERTLEELKAISSRNVEQQKTLQDLIDVNVEGARTASYILEAQRQTKEISEGALGALKNLTLGVAEQHQLTQQIVDVEGLIARTIAGVLDSQKQVKEVGDQTLVELKSIAHGQDEQRKLAQNLVDIGGKTAFAANDILDAQRQGKAELASLLQSLGDRIVKMEEASVGGSRHVWEIKENFIKLCKNVGMMDLIASGVGGQTMLLETLVEEARGTQRVLVEMHEDMRGQTPNGR